MPIEMKRNAVFVRFGLLDKVMQCKPYVFMKSGLWRPDIVSVAEVEYGAVAASISLAA
jgi:hypothetical protein